MRNLFKLFSTASSRQRSSVCLPLPPMLSEFPKVNSPAGTFCNFINSWLRWNERGNFWDVWALGLCGVGQPCASWRGVAWWGVACRSVKRCGVAWSKMICWKVKWCSVASNNEAWCQVALHGVSRSNRMVHGIGITTTKFRRSFYGRNAVLCRHHGLRNIVSVWMIHFRINELR